MAVEVPRSVSVLGLAYAVETADMDGEDGSVSPARQLIRLSSGLSAEKREQVFLHELVHALLDQLGYADLYGDEHLVQGLAIGLHQALAGRGGVPTSSGSGSGTSRPGGRAVFALYSGVPTSSGSGSGTGRSLPPTSTPCPCGRPSGP